MDSEGSLLVEVNSFSTESSGTTNSGRSNGADSQPEEHRIAVSECVLGRSQRWSSDSCSASGSMRCSSTAASGWSSGVSSQSMRRPKNARSSLEERDEKAKQRDNWIPSSQFVVEKASSAPSSTSVSCRAWSVLISSQLKKQPQDSIPSREGEHIGNWIKPAEYLFETIQKESSNSIHTSGSRRSSVIDTSGRSSSGSNQPKEQALKLDLQWKTEIKQTIVPIHLHPFL
jgi:hypothetical protein